MQESIVFLVRVQCRRKESSHSLSHLLMSFLSNISVALNCCLYMSSETVLANDHIRFFCRWKFELHACVDSLHASYSQCFVRLCQFGVEGLCGSAVLARLRYHYNLTTKLCSAWYNENTELASISSIKRSRTAFRQKLVTLVAWNDLCFGELSHFYWIFVWHISRNIACTSLTWFGFRFVESHHLVNCEARKLMTFRILVWQIGKGHSQKFILLHSQLAFLFCLFFSSLTFPPIFLSFFFALCRAKWREIKGRYYREELKGAISTGATANTFFGV